MQDFLAWVKVGGGFVLAVAVLILGPHVYRIVRPRIITYPWKEDKEEEEEPGTGATATTTTESRRTVVFAASYNPPHYGHLRMLEYLSKRYANVIAVVGFNPDKKYLVSPDERADLLREMLRQSDTAGDNVQVAVVDGYIWRYAKRVGATRFFRGIRSWEKDGKEERFLQILNTWGPVLYGPLFVPIPTVYIEGDPKYNHVSSTLIRAICNSDSNSDSNSDTAGGDGSVGEQEKHKEEWLSELVPSHVAGKVAKLYGAKQ
eukprot:jgi/Psemu1/187778/e_gw1.71.121.1